MVERQLPKLNAVGSIPITRSNPLYKLIFTMEGDAPVAYFLKNTLTPTAYVIMLR